MKELTKSERGGATWSTAESSSCLNLTSQSKYGWKTQRRLQTMYKLVTFKLNLHFMKLSCCHLISLLVKHTHTHTHADAQSASLSSEM